MDENDVSREPLVTCRAEVATEEIVLGYAMSRLDEDYLTRRQLSTWSEAYREVAEALSCPPASIKQLRDEFDPFHPNTRVGRRNRDIRPTRQKVMDELREVSNEGVMVLVDNILLGEIEAV